MTTEAIEQQRREIHQIADAIAPTWERRRADIEKVSTPVREWMLRELSLRAGDTVLELAAGVGDSGFDAAGVVGEEGRVISTDLSERMVEAARRRGAERGLGNVEYRVCDAEEIELETDSVDAVLCRFGYMLMADPPRALAETRRVVRPRGRVTLAVWGPMEANPFFTTVAIILIQHGHLPQSEPTGPAVFSLAAPERAAALLERAGFADVRTEEVPVRFELPDAEEYLSFVSDTAGPLGLTLQGLSDAERPAIEAEVEDALARFATDDGYTLPGVALCAVAS